MDLLLALNSGRFTAGVSPLLGGSLVYFSLADDRGIEFVRPTLVRALAEKNVRNTAGYPLVPYSNRIGDGRFRFEDVAYQLDVNSSIPMHPIHGLGWLRGWNVRNFKSVRTARASTESRVTLALTHVASGDADRAWPWSFEAVQNFELDDERLRWSIALTNRDTRAMPAGIGMHPFFPKTAHTEVRFPVKSVWRNNDRMLPLGRTPVPAEWNFAARRPVGELNVDNCFGGWSREATIIWPEQRWGVAIRADDVFSHLVVYTTPARDNIAIEPISHANNAVNLKDTYNDTGLVVLEPGETLSGAFTMRPLAGAQIDAA
jgi:aldose 1-epimerase